ncbi:ferredoxin [Feifania hominis]|uniref:Ferredoxin n=1 Tax=Feifania hominis TaxID=2763660 RepID=A0A926DEV5_9FIRM|nr:ferredoxin [Feifania hominis]MBC8536848.1 ferredoxin [Feifania hominis]
MKASIDRSGCIGCGLCVNICPAVFRFADDGKAEVYADPVPAGQQANAVSAQEGCPVSVIEVSG